MVDVGIRALKAHLSDHLNQVRAGARLTITDRGRGIATIEPIAPVKVSAWVRQLVRDGGVTWSGGKPAGLHPRVRSKGQPASTMVIEDRR